MEKHICNSVVPAALLLLLASCASGPEPVPAWVENQNAVYPNAEYLAQTGKGSSEAEAKAEAVSQLAQFMETQVQGEKSTTYTESESGDSVKESLAVADKKSLSWDIKLTQVEYSDVYYSPKEKIYYCVAYLERDKAWEQYKPVVQKEKESFYAYFNKAEAEPELLYSVEYYAQAYEQSKAFDNALAFGRLINKEASEAEFSEDRTVAAGIPALIAEKKKLSTFTIEVQDDFGTKIYQELKELFSREGYSVKNSGEPALYTVNAVVHQDTASDGDPETPYYVLTPSIEITINGKHAAVFSYSKTVKPAEGYTRNRLEKNAAASIAAELESSLIKEFDQKISRKTAGSRTAEK